MDYPTVDIFRLLVVVVLYRLDPRDSIAFQSLQAATLLAANEPLNIHILLYDNSPEAATPDELPANSQYEVAQQNQGLAGAYNRALELATELGSTWLLTLDQDTTLPSEFIARIGQIARKYEADNSIAAIVPQLSDKGTVLSPVTIRPWGASILPRGFTGISANETHAYNSASLFRVNALRQIGGFSRHFWLDYLDAWVYTQLHRHGRRVYVAGDLQIEHQLSLLDYKNRPSTERYDNFLKAESAYTDLYGGRIRRLALTARLFGRIYRHWKRADDPSLRRLTQSSLKRRLFQSKKRRIDDWQNEMETRASSISAAQTTATAPAKRPSISVCMAAYNGERYITEQLESILCQLAEDDEVIVVDDASTDGTRDRVRALNDKRIRLIVHTQNQGVSRTFQDAIRNASNRILFLSDQDDLWAPHKVSTIMHAFSNNPTVTLIATDVAIIDAGGAMISESYFTGRGKFRPGLWANVVRNRFGGCTMAFRADVISEILPLPHRYHVLHDLWIGVRNSLSGHETLYIHEALVFNRRHTATATGRGKLTPWRRIQIRLHLLLALAEACIRKPAL